MTRRNRRPQQILWVIWLAVVIVVAALQVSASWIARAPAAIDSEQIVVPASRQARVAKVFVRPGDAVAAGAPLVELDATSLDADLAVARAELARMRSEVDARTLTAEGQDFESGARFAQDAEQAKSELAEILAEQKRDKAELAALDAALEREQKLVEQKLASASERDALQLRRAGVAERVAEAGPRADAARAHQQAADKRLADWQNRKGITATRSAPAEAEAKGQEERVRAIEAQRELLTLRAPIAGRVVEVLLAAGGIAKALEPAVTLVDDTAVRATVWVDEQGARRVKVGDRVRLLPADGQEGVRTGAIRALAPAIAELPVRFRQLPSEPMFGRACYVDLDPAPPGDPPSLPGQAFEATF